GKDEAIVSLNRQGGVSLRRALERELKNLVAATQRAVERADGTVAAACYRAAGEVLELQGPLVIAVELGHQVLGASRKRADRALVLATLARAEWRLGQLAQARSHRRQELAI